MEGLRPIFLARSEPEYGIREEKIKNLKILFG